jgi:wobble nucleotide-excising tRNase
VEATCRAGNKVFALVRKTEQHETDIKELREELKGVRQDIKEINEKLDRLTDSSYATKLSHCSATTLRLTNRNETFVCFYSSTLFRRSAPETVAATVGAVPLQALQISLGAP